VIQFKPTLLPKENDGRFGSGKNLVTFSACALLYTDHQKVFAVRKKNFFQMITKSALFLAYMYRKR